MTNRDKILAAAMVQARADGYQWITREVVAASAGVSTGMVNQVFKTVRDLKRAVLREAVTTEDLAIVAQGLADRHEIALNAPPELKRKAALSLVE